MKNLYLKLLIFSLLIVIFQSCDDTVCTLEAYVEYNQLYLQIKDETTQEDLFFGDSAIYELSELGVFVKENGDLVPYGNNFWGGASQEENTIRIASTARHGAIVNVDTFYVQVPNSTLDTFIVNYNRENFGKCHGYLITNSDIQHNGELVCESCTFGDKATIFK
jgi:hypothetical protein